MRGLVRTWVGFCVIKGEERSRGEGYAFRTGPGVGWGGGGIGTVPAQSGQSDDLCKLVRKGLRFVGRGNGGQLSLLLFMRFIFWQKSSSDQGP